MNKASLPATLDPAALQRYSAWADLVHGRVLVAVASRERAVDALEKLRARVADVEAVLAAAGDEGGGRMARLAERFAVPPDVQMFLWAAAAFSVEPRVAAHAEALGGALARRGLAATLFAELFDVGPERAVRLALALAASDNRLTAYGVLTASDSGVPPAARPYAMSASCVAYLRGEPWPELDLRRGVSDRSAHLYDESQESAIDQLRGVLGASNGNLVIVVEGAAGSGRSTALACATGRLVIVLDAGRVEKARAETALQALGRESCLHEALPVIGDVDEFVGDAAAEERVGRFLERYPGIIAVTTATPGIDLRTRRPVVRVRWPTSSPAVRRNLWASLGAGVGGAPTGDLDALALRYRVGPGTITRAVETARTLRPDAPVLDVETLGAGVRHNIAERLGGIARRVEVTQTWDDLVVAEDTRDQIHALIARVRHAPKVLDQWAYRGKMARGTGVPALFSGAPGTGKSMCAGLVARELDLELYQVDLSQVVSKWVGETEKQLSRVFAAAEEGHALLLFDEADALFGQRTTEIKGAVDRYANLEVNYLLQRIEAFNGITILTTNLDTTIDRALKRRLAAHIVFDAPDEDERAELWRRLTSTGRAPLDGRIDFEQLARDFTNMTGANIRNVALAAAFLAAAEGVEKIGPDHLSRAARAEYRTMGHVLADRGRGGSRGHL